MKMHKMFLKTTVRVLMLKMISYIIKEKDGIAVRHKYKISISLYARLRELHFNISICQSRSHGFVLNTFIFVFEFYTTIQFFCSSYTTFY